MAIIAKKILKIKFFFEKVHKLFYFFYCLHTINLFCFTAMPVYTDNRVPSGLSEAPELREFLL